MPTNRHIGLAGFSLVEVMTVLLIIGLVSGAVVLTLPPPKAPAQVQADTLVRQLNALAQGSLLSGIPVAAGFSRSGFALFTFQDHQWNKHDVGIWPERVTARFDHDGIAVDLPDIAGPLVFFEPTGLSSVFSLQLQGRQKQPILYSTGDGRVRLKAVSS